MFGILNAFFCAKKQPLVEDSLDVVQSACGGIAFVPTPIPSCKFLSPMNQRGTHLGILCVPVKFSTEGTVWIRTW